MGRRVADRFVGMDRSATVALHDIVVGMRAAGLRVCDLGGGEPDFATPEHVTAAAQAALAEGFTHYTASRGLPELRAAIAGKLAADNGIVVDPATGVIVTPSAKHALFVAMMTVLDRGDELIVPSPGWVSYRHMARLAGARAVPLALSGADGFRISRPSLEAAVTRDTRAILVNSPNNPTGRALTPAEAADIAAFADAHDLVVITDEIYEKILFDGHQHLSLAAVAGCADRTLTVNGLSKSHAMTGWRLGYLAGPADLIAAALKVQEHTVSCAASFVQRGAVAALTGGSRCVAAMVEDYAARRELLVTALARMPGVRCARPEGTFYAFPDITGTGLGAGEFAEWLLRTAGVAVVPGTAFGPGGEGHVRLSFAAARPQIAEAMERMSAALTTEPR